SAHFLWPVLPPIGDAAVRNCCPHLSHETHLTLKVIGIWTPDDCGRAGVHDENRTITRDVAARIRWTAQCLSIVWDARPNASTQSFRTSQWIPMRRAANMRRGPNSACRRPAGLWRRPMECPLDFQLGVTILRTESSRQSTTTDGKYHPRPNHRPAA